MRRASATVLRLLPLVLATACGADAGSTLPSPSPGEARLRPNATIRSLGIPFDVGHADLVGPGDPAATYGKSPEIVAIPLGDEIDVLFQDTSDPDHAKHFVVRLSPVEGGYALTRALELPALDRIAGFARDDAGHYVYATAVDEARHRPVSGTYPSPRRHRAHVVHVLVVDPETAATLLDVDVDLARGAVDPAAEPIVDPMASSTSRLALGGGRLALLFGHRTAADAGGRRNQKALVTHLALESGAVLATDSVWVSHSFDQRLMHDGVGFVELHLGDAHPRSVAFARAGSDHSSYPLLSIKGPAGENATRTRLGDVVALPPTPGSEEYGYLALFSTEPTSTEVPVAPTPGSPLVAGSRDLAIVRIRGDFEALPSDTLEHLDPALPDVWTVDCAGTTKENRVRFLTTYQRDFPALRHAERPKLVAVAPDRFVVLFERWSFDVVDGVFAFDGTFGMVLDERGEIVRGETRITGFHLPRGDDAFALGGRAAFVTGDAANRRLLLHVIDTSLRYSEFVVY